MGVHGPVCGSTHHPNIDKINNNDKILYIESQIKKIDEKISYATKDYDESIRSQSQLLSTISITEQSIAEIKQEIGGSNSYEIDEEFNKLSKEVISLREKIADWTKNKEDLEEEIKELEKSKNKKEKEEIELSKDILNKTENLNAIKENVEKITKQYDSIKTEYLYLSSSLKIDDLKSKVEEINKNSRIVEQIEEENSSLKLKKEEIDSNLNQKRNTFIELDKNISSLNKENESNQKDKVEKETEFNLITKGQNPKHLLNNIVDEIDSITSTEAKLRVEVEEEKYATEKLKSKISQVKGKLEESKDKYKSSKENLKELLFEYKFESIYAVKNALIDETEREN